MERYTDLVYGNIEIPVYLHGLLRLPIVQRLKSVHQNGAVFLSKPQVKTSRYDHSLGVALLLNQLGASRNEVIAGLLHDLSHTAFSHVIDILFQNEMEDFHEKIVGNFLDDEQLKEELECLEFPDKYLRHLHQKFHLLERDVPQLCADRLDYCLRDCLVFGVTNRNTISHILHNLVVEQGEIACSQLSSAQLLADLFLRLNRDIFYNSEHELINLLLVDVLREALDKNILTFDDFLLTDDHVLSIIKNSYLNEKLNRILNEKFFLQPSGSGNHVLTRKWRVVDPIVLERGCRLSECDSDFGRVFSSLDIGKKITMRYEIKHYGK